MERCHRTIRRKIQYDLVQKEMKASIGLSRSLASPHIVLVLLATTFALVPRFHPQLVASGLCLLATELLAIGVRQVGLCQIERRYQRHH